VSPDECRIQPFGPLATHGCARDELVEDHPGAFDGGRQPSRVGLGVDDERSGVGERFVQNVTDIGRGGEPEETRLGHQPGEPLLVPVDVFAEGGVAGHHDGQQSAGPDLGDRGGAAVADHQVGRLQQVVEVGAVEQGGALGDDGSHAGAVLHEDPQLWVVRGERVHRLDHRVEGVVVGADQRQHEPAAHSSGPTTVARGYSASCSGHCTR
jgi:hypothetical protein